MSTSTQWNLTVAQPQWRHHFTDGRLFVTATVGEEAVCIVARDEHDLRTFAEHLTAQINVVAAEATRLTVGAGAVTAGRYDLIADTVAEVVDLADRFVDAEPEQRSEVLAGLIASCERRAGQMAGGHGRAAYAEIADRLWMVGLSASEVHDLAVTTADSLNDRLIDGDDAVRITGACLRSLSGAQ